MKIAIYQPRASYYVGGAEVVALQHARSLAKRGHKVTIVTVKAKFIKQSEYFTNFCTNNNDVTVVYLPIPDELKWIYDVKPGVNWTRWDNESLYISKIALKHFLRSDYDIVAVHNYLDILGVPHNQKSASHLHGYPAELSYVHKLLKNMPTRYIAVSEFIKNKWKVLIDVTDIRVCRNGIDPIEFAPNVAKKNIDILYVGRLIPIKGINFLIEAVSNLHTQGKYNLKVSIVGLGPQEDELRKQVQSCSTDNIEFLGFVEDAHLKKLYNSSKITVLPSFDKEGILTTMLESSSCGTPVITTTACSMKEFIKDGYNGLLVSPKSSEAISDAIDSLLGNPKLLTKLSINSRESILKDWNWDKKIIEVEKEYEKIISKN